MKKIKVKTLFSQYNILFEKNLLKKSGELIKLHFKEAEKIVLVTNKKIYDIYGRDLIGYLKKIFPVFQIVLKDGEQYKNLKTLEEIYEKLQIINVHRNDVLIAFGGGVVGDTAGFAAATYNRGMNLVQFPTTIISQTDSSIGGKVVVNFNNVKNVIGSFYQPGLVLIDPVLLETLPERELINGFGEIIKYALISDFEIIKKIKYVSDSFKEKKNRLKILIKSDEFFDIISMCASIKAKIVEKDEFDLNYRNILNFGHTIGHSLEKTLGFKNISHGKAVALGMLCALDISISLDYLNKEFKNEIIEVYKLLKLPLKIEGAHLEDIYLNLKYDKKFTSNEMKFIVLKDLNKPFIIKNLDESFIKDSIINNMI